MRLASSSRGAPANGGCWKWFCCEHGAGSGLTHDDTDASRAARRA
jgi:hypothetical protein